LDGLEYSFLGPKAYYYVTSCTKENESIHKLPFEIIGKHRDCIHDSNCQLEEEALYINLHNERTKKIDYQIKMEENFKAVYTNQNGLILDVPINEYISWNDNWYKFYLEKLNDYLLLKVYIFDIDDDNYEIEDVSIKVASTFETVSKGASWNITLSKCYANDYQTCGMCGYYDFSSSNDFLYYDPITYRFNQISTNDIHYGDMSMDAQSRIREFAAHYITDNRTYSFF